MSMTPDMTKSELIESLRTAWVRGERPTAAGANLRGANLREANLVGADLVGADLWGADLWGADLRDAVGGILQVTGLHPYQAVMVPTVKGWRVRIGCWEGTTSDLRDLIAQDHGWPEATGDQITARRPLLAALADLCDLHAANHKDDLSAVMRRWGNKETAPSPNHKENQS